MPDRLDRVAVAYSRGPVEIPWDSRDLLLAQMRPLVSMNSTIAAFEGVGASRPVTLDDDQVSLLIRVIDIWMTNVGPDGLPAGIFDLRRALIVDQHDAGLDP